jgi:hypothetical protein
MLWSALAMFAMAVAAAVRFPRYRLVAVYLAAGCVAVPLFLGYDHLRRQVPASRSSSAAAYRRWTERHPPTVP